MEEIELKSDCELNRDAREALIKLKSILDDEDSDNDAVREAALDVVSAILEDT